MPKPARPLPARLEDLPNVGPRVAADFRRLGIGAPDEIRGRDPYMLYHDLCRATHSLHDPCMLDIAKRLGRKFIGIERDTDYARAADERIAKVRPLDLDAIEAIPSKRNEPRIPFGQILELGILEPGQKLFGPRREVRAEVRADGTLACAGQQASIHRLGAMVQGKAACNGWTYWHFEAEGKLRPIDVLRGEAKRQLGLSGSSSASMGK